MMLEASRQVPRGIFDRSLCELVQRIWARLEGFSLTRIYLYAKNRLQGIIEHTGWCWSLALFGAPLTLFFNFCSTWITIRSVHDQTGSWSNALYAAESWRAVFVLSFLSLNLAQLYRLG